jgi:hypothetical protein
MQRSLLSQAVEDDRRSWLEEKSFLEHEVQTLKEEIVDKSVMVILTS